MDYGYNVTTCRLADQPTKEAIRAKLAQEGQVLDLGTRGTRVIPSNLAYPATYFNTDGTVELVTKDLYYADVVDWMEMVAKRLDTEVVW